MNNQNPFESGNSPFESGNSPFESGNSPFESGNSPFFVQQTKRSLHVLQQEAKFAVAKFLTGKNQEKLLFGMGIKNSHLFAKMDKSQNLYPIGLTVEMGYNPTGIGEFSMVQAINLFGVDLFAEFVSASFTTMQEFTQRRFLFDFISEIHVGNPDVSLDFNILFKVNNRDSFSLIFSYSLRVGHVTIEEQFDSGLICLVNDQPEYHWFTYQLGRMFTECFLHSRATSILSFVKSMSHELNEM